MNQPQSEIIVSKDAVNPTVGISDYLSCYGCPHRVSSLNNRNCEAAWTEIIVDRCLVKGGGGVFECGYYYTQGCHLFKTLYILNGKIFNKRFKSCDVKIY